MVFNKSWAFLKSLEDEQAIKESKEYMDMMEQARRAQLFPNHPEYTIENDFQTTLPMHDFTLDENTGYAGVPPVTAIRYTGDYRAGSPVAQSAYNTVFEGTESSGYFPKKVPDIDFNAPSVDAPHGKLAPKGWKNRPPTDKDADYGYPDKGGWLHRDPESGAHYWYKNGRKHFMDVREGAKGSWWSYPTEEDFDRAAGAESNPTKIVGIRGDPSKYGIVSQRDSLEAPEKLAEMYLLHSKNIPRHALVETAMRENIPGKRNENRMDTARRVGIPKRIGATSRWSNKPLPFSTSRVKKPFEDLTEEELYGLAGMDMPMKKAFQLLKGSTKQSTLWGYDPKIVNDLLAEKNSNIFIAAKPGRDAMPVNEQNRRSDTMLQELTKLKEKHGDFDITSATGRAGWEAEPSFMLTNVPDTARDAINEIAARYKQDSIGVSERGEQGVNYVTPEGETVEDGKFSGMEIQENPEYSTDFPSGQRLTFTYGEPMDIAFQLLKERKSPAAFAHKLEYDKQYQKTPKRVKYREQLNAERRKRGIYGKGGKDVSHTQGGKLTLENAHANRARHFKNRGTLRRVKVKK